MREALNILCFDYLMSTYDSNDRGHKKHRDNAGNMYIHTSHVVPNEAKNGMTHLTILSQVIY